MSLTFTISNTEIPISDIKTFPIADEKIIFAGVNLIASKLDIVLDNTDTSKYDDRVAGSLFFGSAWVNDDVEIYDSELQGYIWQGKLKSLIVNQGNRTVTCVSHNYVQDLAQTKLVYTNATNLTGAAIIQAILEDVIGIPADGIDYNGFQDAIVIQENNNVYFNITYTEKDNVSALQAISEICRITQCELYTVDNKLYLYQWQAYDGAIGNLVEKKNLIGNDYVHEFNYDIIYNSYSIKYDSSGTIAVATNTDTASITKYGTRSFVVPNQKKDSTTSTDYKILLRNGTGAAYCGALAISRYQEMRKFFTCTLSKNMSFSKLNDQIDLNFDSMIREPARIVDRKYNRERQTISIRGEFLNTPYAYYTRDTDPPAVVELQSAFSLSGGAAIKWSQSQETDHVGYEVAFTATNGEWFSEFSNLGSSPLDVKNPSTTPDGYAYLGIYQLNEGSTYYFKVRSYDTSFNYSSWSNIKSCTIQSVDENRYMVSGDIFGSIVLDADNSGSGTPLTGWTLYDSETYGDSTYSPCAVFESTRYTNTDGFTSITFRGSGKIYYQYRTYDLTDEKYGSWSTETSASGLISIDLDGYDSFQFRIIYKSDVWTDSDNFYVTEIL